MKAFRLSYGELQTISPAEAATARGAVFYGESLREVLETMDSSGIGKFLFQTERTEYAPDPANLRTSIIQKVPTDGFKKALDSIRTFGNAEYCYFERKTIQPKDIPDMLEFDPEGKKLKGIAFDTRALTAEAETYKKYFTKAGNWSPATAVSRLKLARKRADNKLTKAKAQNEFKMKVPSPSVLMSPLIGVLSAVVKERIKFMVHSYMSHAFMKPTTDQYVEYIKEISPLFDFVVGKKDAMRDTMEYNALFNSVQPQIKLIREAVEKETAHPIWSWVVDEYPIYLRNLRKKEKETKKND